MAVQKRYPVYQVVNNDAIKGFIIPLFKIRRRVCSFSTVSRKSFFLPEMIRLLFPVKIKGVFINESQTCSKINK
jgi:hypothetical protein